MFLSLAADGIGRIIFGCELYALKAVCANRMLAWREAARPTCAPSCKRLESRQADTYRAVRSAATEMKKAFLIYNPASGQKRQQRAEDISRVAAVFHAAGVHVDTCTTTHAGSAIQQAQEAARASFDAVVACGGDGTANEVLNGLARSSCASALGVLPLGSGKLLAVDHGITANAVTDE